MKKQNLLISVIIIVAAVALGIYLMQREVSAPVQSNGNELSQGMPVEQEDITVDLSCASDKAITATFHLPEDESVDLMLSDGRAMNLSAVVSASGVQYANADQSIVFWSKGNGGILTENGETTYTDCLIDEASMIEALQ